jgi:hypothetical protein
MKVASMNIGKIYKFLTFIFHVLIKLLDARIAMVGKNKIITHLFTRLRNASTYLHSATKAYSALFTIKKKDKE